MPKLTTRMNDNDAAKLRQVATYERAKCERKLSVNEIIVSLIRKRYNELTRPQ